MKILVSDDVSEKGVELLRRNGYDVEVQTNLDEDGLIACIGEYDGLVTRSMTHVTANVIAAAKKLKVIGRAGVGVDSIDIKAATQRGIIVVNAPESNTVAATEHTCAMIMAVTRHIPQAYNSLLAGEWDRERFTGIQLRGKTIGIVGVGRIGSRIAKRMQAMEMRTIGCDPYIPEERGKQLGVELVDLDTLLKEADYITLHTPLTKETRGMIGAAEIAKMKEGVRLINVSRGAVLDIEALAAALKSGHVAGAAIDVFPTEPLTTDINPFIGMDNVVITPHLGASTIEAQEGVSLDVAEGVMAALRGEPVPTAVNMAPIPKNVYTLIQPYFDLMERMGILGVYLSEGPMREISVEYTGKLADTEIGLLTTAVLKGALNPILQESVNFVNAPEVARTRHISVKEIKSHDAGYFLDAVTVRIKMDKGEHSLVGTLFNNTEAKIVQIDEYRVDFTPEGYLLLAPHIDQPNMIGQISTILGQAHININGMQVGKMTKAGHNIMAIAVQDDIPNDIMLKLRSIDGILGMKLIHCETQS
ncbi:phosphoglycerate dehydrogenase [Megasphaera vaginalis (ex Bordigoni et al. 2020)]|uniref:phosphoglycerate dehydrogenase n=1 Tax=Megasphaera vaginalis (ex Bordigoni et al. 2020) TaxID=2045301 RepID=UPI000C7C4383|nr:phosphoglycerate dehydrogenase [Megasphaera vaginalis (ex Bordigoni et al. 2020)]